MRTGTYPGRLTREQWLALSIKQRCLLSARARSDLLELWKSCRRTPCRRAHACRGDDKCWLRPVLPDLNNPDRNRPDFQPSYRRPEHLRIPNAILDQLPYLVEPWSLHAILEFCAAEAGEKAAEAMRRIFRLDRQRRRTTKRRAA